MPYPLPDNTAAAPPEAAAEMAAEIERIRGAGVLGRPGQLSRLFDFIAERSLLGSWPKESEIALAIFSRDGDFAGGQDAVVRVYVHRLRKRLEDFYLRSDFDGRRLSIPRGEYRLILQTQSHDEPAPTTADDPPLLARRQAAQPISKRMIAAIAAGFLVVNLGGWGLAAQSKNATGPQQAFVRSPIWKPLASERFPLLVVVGDYYIFGDTDTRGNVERLIRDFSINSRDELYHYMMTHEDAEYRYMDLNLTYLPVSTAFAMQDLAPLIAGRTRTWVVTTSQLTPQMLQDNDIIYIGYLSGLGPLRDAAFRGSRWATGENFDEILDRKTSRRYRSEGGHASASREMFRDYGYFTTFPGPRGNRISIIAGTRDVAVSGTAEAVTDITALRQLPSFKNQGAVEALYEVEGGSGSNLKAQLVLAAERDATDLWSTAQRVPAKPVAPTP